jgi:hypothetical protein
MRPPLEIDSWKRRGHTLLWDASSLASLCHSEEAVTLRRFLLMHKAGWPDAELEATLVKGRALVVAGLDAALDAMDPDAAMSWLETVAYPAIISFEKNVADGASQAALIFWFADGRRLRHNMADLVATWDCSLAYGQRQIPLSRGLWNGSSSSMQEIRERKAEGKSVHVGFYVQKISA